MKIVSWNCAGKFREDYEEIFKQNADIYVIPECEDPKDGREEYKEYKEFVENFAGNNIFWKGDLHYKGLGVFLRKDFNVDEIKGLDENFKNFIALRVNDSFNLLGVWAMTIDDEKDTYVEMIHGYFDANYDKIFDENLIMCGDFNSNTKWDDDHKKYKDNYNNDKNHTNLNIKLNNKGLYSAYHNQYDEEQGKETKPTFYLHYHLDEPSHIDYVYAKKGRISKFEILDSEKWIDLSDHMPIVFEFEDV